MSLILTESKVAGITYTGSICVSHKKYYIINNITVHCHYHLTKFMGSGSWLTAFNYWGRGVNTENHSVTSCLRIGHAGIYSLLCKAAELQLTELESLLIATAT